MKDEGKTVFGLRFLVFETQTKIPRPKTKDQGSSSFRLHPSSLLFNLRNLRNLWIYCGHSALMRDTTGLKRC